jgi:hypothetical protein
VDNSQISMLYEQDTKVRSKHNTSRPVGAGDQSITRGDCLSFVVLPRRYPAAPHGATQQHTALQAAFSHIPGVVKSVRDTSIQKYLTSI